MEINQITLGCIAKINDDNVVSRDLEGEAVMLNLDNGVYFGLDEVGTRVWELIQKNGSLLKVLEAMQQEYDVAPQTLERDLLQLVEELRARGLVSVFQRDEPKAAGS